MREIEEVTHLRGLMKDWKLSMERVAREMGISSRTVFRWLHGQNEPSGLALEALRRYLDGGYLPDAYVKDGEEPEFKE
jgi:DNA-binding transcriptional regulator YiaG